MLPLLPQVVCPVGHVQFPETHAPPAGHACAQAPQLLTSVAVSTQPEAPQETSDPVHTHAGPAVPETMHEEPGPHTVPHAPQLKLSLMRFTHVLVPFAVHIVGAVGGHEHVAGAPPHVPPIGQAWPQVPQLAGSFVRFAHPVVHIVAGAAQVQAPFTHVSPIGHAFAHVPQFPGSVCVLVQTAPH